MLKQPMVGDRFIDKMDEVITYKVIRVAEKQLVVDMLNETNGVKSSVYWPAMESYLKTLL